METEEKKLISEHTQAIKDLIQNFQKFYKVASHILPEIEHTETLKRKAKDLEDFKKRNPETAWIAVANIRVNGGNNAPDIRWPDRTWDRGVCRIWFDMDLLRRRNDFFYWSE